MGSLYLLFIAVSGADLLLTANGLRVGFLDEANPFLVKMADLANMNLVVIMGLAKAFAACLAWWLAFRLPAELQQRAQRGRFALVGSPSTILIVLTVATALLGVLPGMAGHFRHYLIG